MLPALLTFAEVAKQQSFTRAAEHLGMSKSAVSQQVKRLEEQIGQQLFISPGTARNHISNIFQKTDTHSRMELFSQFNGSS